MFAQLVAALSQFPPIVPWMHRRSVHSQLQPGSYPLPLLARPSPEEDRHGETKQYREYRAIRAKGATRQPVGTGQGHVDQAVPGRAAARESEDAALGEVPGEMDADREPEVAPGDIGKP